GHAAGLQGGRHLDRLHVAGRLREHEGEGPEGRVHGAAAGQARLGVRLHARRAHEELLPRARVRRVVHQPRGRRADGEPLLLRERRRDDPADRDQGQVARAEAEHRRPERARPEERPHPELGGERERRRARMAGGASGLTARGGNRRFPHVPPSLQNDATSRDVAPPGEARLRRKQAGMTAADVSAPAAARRMQLRAGRGWLALPTTGFLVAVLIVPLVLIGLYSVDLMTNLVGVPTGFSVANWSEFLPPGDNVFLNRFETSILITLLVSVLAVLGAYPIAYFLAFVARRRRYTLLMLVLAPFFTSYLLRVIAWKVVLDNNGVVNSALWQLGLRHHGDGISWLIYSWFSVALVLFYSWVPFVALPIYVVLENLDTRLLEAAQDLGGGRLHVFRRITLPLSLPGVIAAFV